MRVEARGWGWRHAGRRAWALRGVDLVVEPGERVLLLGPSGSGKSTLLAALAGLTDTAGTAETEGSLLVDGRAPREARSCSGLLLQDPEASLVMGRAGDDVAFGLENAAVPLELLWPRVDEALAVVGFPYGRQRSTATLSGGEKQRLALAGVLALRPGLLLLDEPTSALDPAGAALVRAAVRAGVEAVGATLVLVEHRVDEALDLVDRVVVLAAGGGVVADGAPGPVFAAHGDALAAAGVWVPDRAPTSTCPEPDASAPGPAADRSPVVRLDEVRHPHLGTAAAATARDLLLPPGEALVVTGPNGCGKSTLALLAAGLLEPTAGGARAPDARGSGADRPLHRWRARPLAALVGTVFQEPEHQFLCRTVADELDLGLLRQGATAAAARARTQVLLDRLHLRHLAAANPFTLSGGEQRRLSVATALATQPRLLVLDEPTFGQDARTWVELVDLLRGLRDDGAALLTVTHDTALTDALADRRLDLAATPIRC